MKGLAHAGKWSTTELCAQPREYTCVFIFASRVSDMYHAFGALSKHQAPGHIDFSALLIFDIDNFALYIEACDLFESNFVKGVRLDSISRSSCSSAIC